MLPRAVCLLLVAQCLATGQHEQTLNNQKHKIPHLTEDSNKINKYWTVPDTKLIYNYEQMKAGQDPQIENKIEDLSQYVNLNLMPTISSTTTTPQPVDELVTIDKATGINEVFDTTIIAEEKPHHHRHHHHSKHPNITSTTIPNLPQKQDVVPDLRPYLVYPAYFPTLPPPPALPQYVDFNEVFKYHPHHQHGGHTSKPHHISSQKLQREQTTSATAMKSVLHTHMNASKKHGSRYHVSTLPSQNEYVTSASVKPIITKIQPAHSQEHDTKHKQHHMHRGNHKFTQDEINQQTPITFPASSTMSTLSFQNGETSPPVPTLSPWYDGFGK